MEEEEEQELLLEQNLEEIMDAVQNPLPLFIPHSLLIPVISVQEAKVARFVLQKDKQGINAMVFLQVLYFLQAGRVLQLEIGEEGELSTADQLKTNVHQVATAMYESYMKQFPAEMYLLPMSSEDEVIALLQAAQEGDGQAMEQLVPIFEGLGNKEGAAYWKEEAVKAKFLNEEEEKKDLSLQQDARPIQRREESFKAKSLKRGRSKEVLRPPLKPMSTTPAAARDKHLQQEILKLSPLLLTILRMKDGVLRAGHGQHFFHLLSFPLLFLLFLGQLNNPTTLLFFGLSVNLCIAGLLISAIFKPSFSQDKEITPMQLSLSTLQASLPTLLPAVYLVFFGQPLSSYFLIPLIVIIFGFGFTLYVLSSINPDSRKMVGQFINVHNPDLFGLLLIHFSLSLFSGSIVVLFLVLGVVVFFGILPLLKERDNLPLASSTSKVLIPYIY